MKLNRLLEMAGVVVLAVTSLAQSVDTVVTNDLDEPYGIVADAATSDNHYYIADSANNRIVKYTAKTGEFVDLTGRSPDLFSPHGIVLVGRKLVIADSGNHQIKEKDLATGVLSRKAGSAARLRGAAAEGAGTNALAAFFNAPSGLAVDALTNIYIGDAGNHCVRKLAPDGTVTVYASRTNGFNWPTGLALGPDGRLYVADTGNDAIRVVETNGTVKLMVSGLSGPRGLLWIGGHTGLLVSDTRRHTITRIHQPFPSDPDFWVSSTFAGAAGIYGSANGSYGAARFFEPVGMSMDVNGDIVIADLKNNAIRKITRPPTQQPIFDPAGGKFSDNTSVKVTSQTTNAIFRYTLDGSDPTTASPLFPAALEFRDGGPVGLKVRAFSPDLAASAIVSNNYSFFVAAITNSVADGAYTNDVLMKLATPTSGALIRYTLDDTAVATNSPPWVDGMLPPAIETTWAKRLRAKAFRDGYDPSEERSVGLTFRTDEPVIIPPGRAGQNSEANEPYEAYIESGTLDTVFLTTFDNWKTTNAIPSRAGKGSTDKFNVEINGLLEVVASKRYYESSPVRSASFPLKVGDLTMTPNGTNSVNTVQVVLASKTPGADIFYTLDGKEATNNAPRKVLSFTNGVYTVLDIAPSTNNPSILYTNGEQGFALTTNTTVKVRAYYKGFEVVSASGRFELKTSEPIIDPPGTNSNNELTVALQSLTTNTTFLYTVDGSNPSRSNPKTKSVAVSDNSTNAVTFVLSNSGPLKVVGTRLGFADSTMVSATYALKVADPVLEPKSADSFNDVTVVVTDATVGASLKWVIGADKDPLTDGRAVVGGSFVVNTNGLVKVIGTRTGFDNSSVVSGAFNLRVAKPTIEVDDEAEVVVNQLRVTNFTSLTVTNVLFRYTINGTTPSSTNGVAWDGNPILVRTNTLLKVAGVRPGYADSEVAERQIKVKVDKPAITPPFGYFPNGTEISFAVQRTDATIRYTLDDSDPKTTSTAYTAGEKIRLNALTGPNKDLRSVRARAFAPNCEPSDVAQGLPLGENTIGVPVGVRGGVGATIVVPVVINMKDGDELRSLQYRVLVNADTNRSVIAPDMASTQVRALSTGPNDFVAMRGVADGSEAAVFSWTAYGLSGSPLTNVAEIVFLGTNAHFKAVSFATVNLLAITIPTNAPQGSAYVIRVDRPSGTRDGLQQNVPLTALPERLIEVTNISYVVGDSSPGIWYNAGDFGDSTTNKVVLNNADVNNAFNASLGLLVPFSFTDAFDALDAFPEDTDTDVGGDGQIRYLDWQRILGRSLLRPGTQNWRRSWTTNGVRKATLTTAPVSASPALPATEIDNTLRGQLWPDAVISADQVGDAQPGQGVSLPVLVRMVNGGSLDGVQFRAVVKGDAGAPALDRLVEFVPANGIPQPLRPSVLPEDQVASAWSPLLNPLVTAIRRAQLGTINFTIPADALPGQTYRLEFLNADGGQDANTPADIAGVAGSVRVGAPAEPPNEADRTPRGFKLRWQGLAGQLFVVESTSDLSSGQWVMEAQNLAGRGAAIEFVDRQALGQAKFYRIRVQR